MAQFDVYINPNKSTRGLTPYLVDLQNDLLAGLSNRVMAPLRKRDGEGATVPVLRLNPVVRVEDLAYVVRMQDLAAISARGLGQPIANLNDERTALLAALDLLFTGF